MWADWFDPGTDKVQFGPKRLSTVLSCTLLLVSRPYKCWAMMLMRARHLGAQYIPPKKPAARGTCAGVVPKTELHQAGRALWMASRSNLHIATTCNFSETCQISEQALEPCKETYRIL